MQHNNNETPSFSQWRGLWPNYWSQHITGCATESEWGRENERPGESWRDRGRRVLLFLLMEVDIRHPAEAWNKAMSNVSWVTQISLHSNRPFLSNRLPSFCPGGTAIYTCIYKPSESSLGSWHRLLRLHTLYIPLLCSWLFCWVLVRSCIGKWILQGGNS